MSFMLSGCKNLTSIDLSKFNTKKVSNMTEMFSFCKNLNSIDISNFDFNNEINKPYILLNCFNLKKVIVNKKFEDIEKKINDKNYIKSNYYLTNSINFKFESSKYYFGRYFEYIIVELNLNNFNTNNVNIMNGMFNGCSYDLKIKIKSENKNIKDKAFIDND